MRKHQWRYVLFTGATLAALLIAAGARWKPWWPRSRAEPRSEKDRKERNDAQDLVRARESGRGSDGGRRGLEALLSW